MDKRLGVSYTLVMGLVSPQRGSPARQRGFSVLWPGCGEIQHPQGEYVGCLVEQLPHPGRLRRKTMDANEELNDIPVGELSRDDVEILNKLCRLTPKQLRKVADFQERLAGKEVRA